MIFDIVGNKMDLYQNEEISEKEAREYAKSIGAGYHLVSCKQSVGIKDLFEDCAKRYLETSKLTEKNKEKDNISLSLDKNQTKVEKKKCC